MTESNEHDESSAMRENPQIRAAQQSKRMRKGVGMKQEIPDPTWYGPDDAEMTLVCWGSTYGPAREAVDRLNAQETGKANLLHFSGLEPFPPGAEAALRRARKRVVVEGNYTGQLELLIRMRTGLTMDGAVRRFDGRPFRPQYILDGIKEVD